MNAQLPPTSLARLDRRTARFVLVVVVLSIVTAVAVSLSSLAKGYAGKPSRGANDVALYCAEVDRIRAGEGYYAAASVELRSRGYPTRSVFNWRTPLPIWLLGVLPDPVFGKGLLCGLALTALLFAFDWLAREGGALVALTGTLGLCGAMLPCLLGDLFVMPVLWSGVLLLLSLALLAANRTGLGVAAGLAALFIRELAGPFVAVMLTLALCRRRYREAGYWTAGLVAYGFFFLWHVAQVSGLQTPGDRAHAESWVQLGGLALVVSMTQMNGWLLVLPQWIAAIYLPLALLGFASWKGPAGERGALAAATYVLLFGFVGQDFNQYWGSLIAPLMCLGIAWSLPAIRDLVHAARGQALGSVETPGVDAASAAG